MIVRVLAGWLVPIVNPALRHGWLDVDASRDEIIGIGVAGSEPASPPDIVLDLGEVVLLPGLVNAHTHLELSHMAGAVPPAGDFVTWVRTMLAVRFGAVTSAAVVNDSVVSAIEDMHAAGTAGVGDIGNTDASLRPLAASSLRGVHFREALGFSRADAQRVASETHRSAVLAQARLDDLGCTRLVASVAPHAPYSTSAPLIQALAAGPARTGVFESGKAARMVSSIHLGESPEEIEFLARGTGPLRELLADMGRWDHAWAPPETGPVAYLEALDALHERLLIVHGTQFTTGDLRTIAAAGSTLVICPRSNRWVGVGVPPVSAAFEAGVRLALGTDSLASVEDLNLFAELAFLRQIAPDIGAASLLRAATRGGADALRCPGLGVLAPGATSHAVVRVPPAGIADVEEWLVADAADTGDLRWLDEIVAEVACANGRSSLL